MTGVRRRLPPVAPLCRRADDEVQVEAQLLVVYKDLILGPEFLGGDLYEHLLAALTDTETERVGLTELLFRFGVTDVTGLVLLLRAVALTTSISTLGWVLDDQLPAEFLHQTGTYRHPLTAPD